MYKYKRGMPKSLYLLCNHSGCTMPNQVKLFYATHFNSLMYQSFNHICIIQKKK